MTRVVIAHNPFMIKTEMVIDGENVVETSSLYRYLRTPMQDWVSNFLPALVEHCNDDEIEITFRGLQFNYDDLERELKLFLKQNREYDISLQADVCKSQIARLGAIDSFLNEMQSQTKVPELKEPAFLKTVAGAEAASLQILVVGGTRGHRGSFVNDLVGADLERSDPTVGYCFVDDDSENGIEAKRGEGLFQRYRINLELASREFCRTEIYELPDLERCANTYYRFLKKAINAEEKPIILYILEEDVQKNSAESLNMIADQYGLRGKQNKWRFIFVAKDPVEGKRMLMREYAIRNAQVYTLDGIEPIQRHIEEYQNEVCLVREVKTRCETLTEQLTGLEIQISERAEQEKAREEIDKLEQDAIKLLYQCEGRYSCPYKSTEKQDESIESFLARLSEEYQMYFAGKQLAPDKARENIRAFVRTLPYKIDGQINEERRIAMSGLEFFIPPELWEVLGELRCESAIERLNSLKLSSKEIQELFKRKAPSPNEYLTQIQNLGFKELQNLMWVPGETRLKLVVKLRDMQAIRLEEEGASISFAFYVYLCLSCAQNLLLDNKLDAKKLAESRAMFEQGIQKIKPVLKGCYSDYISLGQQVVHGRNTKLEVILPEIESSVRQCAQQLREISDISKEEKKKLTYIQDLKQRVSRLTCL